jgi:hypothetical protein
MTDAKDPALAGRLIPPPGSHKLGVAQVRLVCPPEVMDAALALLGDLLGEAWQPSARKRSRHAGGDELQYGTLIVPVPRKDRS